MARANSHRVQPWSLALTHRVITLLNGVVV